VPRLAEEKGGRVKERPILFSGPMVRAQLDGSKTQTRRVVKPAGAHHIFQFRGDDEARGADEPTGKWAWCSSAHVVSDHIQCPFGKPGDRLWVREAWRSTSDLDAHSGARIAELCLDAGYRSPWAPIQYEADTARRNWEHTTTPPHDREPAAGRYRHARFMPRWASRITLEVTGVRVERLQDISEADAISEGWPRDCFPLPWYRDLWDSLAAPGADWAANPWVWVVEFKRVT
jgi:hypothetical protein